MIALTLVSIVASSVFEQTSCCCSLVLTRPSVLTFAAGTQCAFKQTPNVAKQPKRIPLAHGLYDELTADILLITKYVRVRSHLRALPLQTLRALARGDQSVGVVKEHSLSTLITLVALSLLSPLSRDPQEEYEELARSKNLPGRITVMSVKKLKSDFKPFEAKRQLCQSYDLFLADDRCVCVCVWCIRACVSIA